MYGWPIGDFDREDLTYLFHFFVHVVKCNVWQISIRKKIKEPLFLKTYITMLLLSITLY